MNTAPILVDPSPEREIIDFRPLGFHDVVILGRYDYSSSHPQLEMHCHGQMMEICLLAKGRQVYVVEGTEYALEGGDVFITYPGELHGTGSHPEGKGQLYWLLLNVPKSQERFLSLAPSDWHSILGPLLKRRPRLFRGANHLKVSLDRIFAVRKQEFLVADPVHKVNLQNWMLRFLLDVTICAAGPVDRSPSEGMQQVLRAIDEKIDSEEEIRLDGLASLAGLSLSRFKFRFRSEIGIPPAEYIVRRKVEKASQWLIQGDQTVTDIAMRLGFSTSQYFATVYKRFTGKSPSQVRNSHELPPL